MKLSLDRQKLDLNVLEFLREAGYGYIYDQKLDKESFVRRFTRGFYPRFHMYANVLEDRIEFNLHIDQKKASYEGSHMHNAEYNSEAVRVEMQRVKRLLIIEKEKYGGSEKNSPATDALEEEKNSIKNIGHGDFQEDALDTEPKKKRWWNPFN